MINKIIQIFTGWYKYLFTNSKQLIEDRTSLCRECPVSKRNGKYTGWCRVNNGGCGCYLNAKTAHHDEWCDKGVWGPDILNKERLKEVIEDYEQI